MPIAEMSHLQNSILKNLPPVELNLINPLLTAVNLRRSEHLVPYHARVENLFFIETGFASVVGVAAQRRTINIALIGREGVAGATALLDIDYTPHDCYMQVEGSAYRIAVDDVCSIVDQTPALYASILKFVNVLLVQSAEAAVCNRTAAIEPRLARVLLMCHDRLDCDELAVTHEVLAGMLGVRRATVTVALHVLEGERTIKSLRGRVRITDRAKLEAAACGSYGSVESEYTRIFKRTSECLRWPGHTDARASA